VLRSGIGYYWMEEGGRRGGGGVDGFNIFIIVFQSMFTLCLCCFVFCFFIETTKKQTNKKE
jgi:hypothetical protein